MDSKLRLLGIAPVLVCRGGRGGRVGIEDFEEEVAVFDADHSVRFPSLKVYWAAGGIEVGVWVC